MIQLQQLSFRYGMQNVVNGVNYSFERNTIYGIIGPNGVGKSTLLQLIAGIRKPSLGTVMLDGKPLAQFHRKEIAKRIAVLQQGGLPALGFTVKEVVAMGRYPYQNWLGTDEGNSEQLVLEAIEATGLTQLAERRLEELSGGERQRAALAKVLVQQPDVLLLDEPTTYLDIGYQQLIMDLVKQWQSKGEMLVIAVMHDLNIAALYCDKLIALHKGKILADGSAQSVMNNERISTIYDADTVVINHPEYNVPQLLLKIKENR